MHELSIAEKIVKTVETELRSHDIKDDVKNIIFKAGQLSAIIPDSLSFHFDLLKKDHPQLQRAELTIVVLPVVAFCKNCSLDYELSEPIFICKKCSGPLEIKSGQELIIESFNTFD